MIWIRYEGIPTCVSMAGMNLGFLIGGGMLLGAATFGVFTGKYHGKYGGYTSRSDNPVYFWILTSAFYLFGVGLLAAGFISK
jgi:hypothetical protein